jgi:hypothetical protein
MCDVEQYLHIGTGSCLAGTNFEKKIRCHLGATSICTTFVQIAAIVRIVLASMIFTNSYVDPAQIAAIVRIAVWQLNQFVLNLAPILFI